MSKIEAPEYYTTATKNMRTIKASAFPKYHKVPCWAIPVSRIKKSHYFSKQDDLFWLQHKLCGCQQYPAGISKWRNTKITWCTALTSHLGGSCAKNRLKKGVRGDPSCGIQSFSVGPNRWEVPHIIVSTLFPTIFFFAKMRCICFAIFLVSCNLFLTPN